MSNSPSPATGSFFAPRQWWIILSLLTVIVTAITVYQFRRSDSAITVPDFVTPKEIELAKESFMLAQGHPPKPDELVFWLANLFTERKRFEDAVACYSKIPISHPEFGRRSRFQQGQILLGLNRAMEAEKNFRELLALEEADPRLESRFRVSARQQLRHILEVELRFEERAKLLQPFLEQDETDGFETLATLFPTHLRWNSPIGFEFLEKFYERDRDQPILRTALGRYYTVQGRLEEARTHLEATARQLPNDLGIKAALIALLREANDPDLNRQMDSLPPANPDDPWLLQFQRAEHALQANQFQQAASYYEAIIRRDPTCTQAWQGLVQATRTSEESDSRIQAIKMAAGLGRIQYQISRCLQTPTDAPPYLAVADACLDLDLNREGLILSRLAERLDPGNARAAESKGRFQSRNTSPLSHWQLRSVTTPIETPANDIGKLPANDAVATFKLRDATGEWNLHFQRFDDISNENRNMEGNGGGVAIFDFDLDGRLDLFFTQGGRLPLKKYSQDKSNELFRNLGTNDDQGNLVNVTSHSGLTQTGFHTGCAVGDMNSDGFPDLYISSYGRSSIWMNSGDGTFRDASASSPVVDTWGTSIAIADLNGDGWLDVYLAAYLKASDDPPTICREPGSPTGTTQCSPTMFSALDDFLLVNDGEGGFLDVTHDAGITAPDGRGLGVTADDVNGDGKLDLFVANDLTASFLYLNETTTDQRIAGTNIVLPKFRECGIEYGVALNGDGAATAAMGIAHGDYDRNGWDDLFVTNFYLEANTLFRNLAGQSFIDQSTRSRLGPVSRNSLAFGTEFLDIDHDQWQDLIVTTGHLEDRTWTGTEPYKMRPLLFRNDRNGQFSDVGQTAGDYFRTTWVGRGLACGDLDRDGDMDIVISHQVDPSHLLINDTPRLGTSVIIKPVGVGTSPRSGIGCRIVANGISPMYQKQLAGGGSFQSASALEIHMPLAEESSFQILTMTWPDGTTEEWENVAAGYYVAIQGRGLIRVNLN
ncbi:MAG: FG-GAP-like repeat-containing protein [Planctomycetaceae bacterium]